MSLSVEVKTGEMKKRLNKKTNAMMRRSLVSAMKSSALLCARHVVTRKLLGQYLNRRTGTAIRSISASPRAQETETGAEGIFGSNLDYVRAHELGFKGEVAVRETLRRLTTGRNRRTGNALKKRKRTGFSTWVKAHDRSVNMPARKFFQHTLQEKRQTIGLQIKKAILITLRFGRVASVSDLQRSAIDIVKGG